MKKINILDCTLRDGGYYNNWNFSNELVNDYLKAISLSGIRYVELGFRSLKKNDFKGPNWYTTDSYIGNLSVPKNLKLGVMVNVFEIISSPLGITKTINLLFKSQKKSKIKFVRLAAHFNEFVAASKICKILQAKGYLACINVMQISELSTENIIFVAKKAQEIKPDMLYFADSLGGMKAPDIINIIKIFKTYWKGSIGIHTHDNLEEALSNSLTAINNGANWIDSTVSGMGRGPGNTKTEYLILEAQSFLKTEVNIAHLVKLINKHFEPLKKIYKWGTNSFYYLAGKYGIHPTYIQEMLSIKLKEIDMLAAINQIKDHGGRKYNVNLVKSEFQKPIKLIKGTWLPETKMKNKEVMLISSGPKLNEYKNEIERYIKVKKPVVIALNTEVKINKNLIDMYLACNPLKLMADAELYKSIKSPLIVPQSLLTEKLTKKFKNIKLLDFGIGLKDNKYEFYKNCALIPKLYNFAYALSIVTSGKASKILLAGFDGYSYNDRRTKIVDDLFFLYSSHKKSKKIISVTPSLYNFATTSIYAL